MKGRRVDLRLSLPWFSRGIHSPFKGTQSQSQRRDTQKMLERFWSPFCQQMKGPELKNYSFSETFKSVRTDDEDFTCQVNTAVGNAKLMEDFFIALLCGFDFSKVEIAKPRSTDAFLDPCDFKGTLTLQHSRPFLGWHPSAPVQQICGGVPDTFADASPLPAPFTVRVPFSARLEGTSHSISHMILRSPALDVIAGCPNCPAAVQRCLRSSDAMRALVSLRRANVRPELITDQTLSSITTKKEAWASAVGIL